MTEETIEVAEPNDPEPGELVEDEKPDDNAEPADGDAAEGEPA